MIAFLIVWLIGLTIIVVLNIRATMALYKMLECNTDATMTVTDRLMDYIVSVENKIDGGH